MRDDHVPFPHPWPEKLLGSVAKVAVGGTPSTAVDRYWGGDIPWMASGDIHLRRILDVPGRITRAGLKGSNAVVVEPDAVAMALAGQGKTRGTVALTKIKLCTNQSVALISPSRDHLLPEFLYQALIPRYDELRSRSAGGGRGGLTKAILEQVPIQLPSLSEQQGIADALSALDEQIAQTEASVEKEQSACTGLLQVLIPEGFDVDVKPKNVLADVLLGIESGKSFMCSDQPAEQGCWGVLKVSAVRSDGFHSVENKAVQNPKLINEKFEVKHGDLLITRANTAELVGAACLVDTPPSKLLLCDKTLRLRPNSEVNSAYLWLWLQTPVARKHIDAHATGTSAGMKNIGQSAIRGMPLHLPELNAQTRRTEPVIAQLDLLRVLKVEAHKLRLQKKGLMHDLLTGATRVR